MNLAIWNLPVLRLLATDRCRVAAPWFRWHNSDDDASQLRRRANALEQTRLGADNPLERGAAVLLYLPLSVPRLLLALWRWGPGLREADGVSYGRQALDLAFCAWRLGLRPQVYYYLRLHRRQRAPGWASVIDPSELHYLQHEISPTEVDELEDKAQFHTRATAHGLPVAPCLALWTDGRLTAPARNLRQDLFVKRARSYGSRGVMAFRYDPATHDEAALAETLARASKDKTLLVQPRLQNHPDLQGFSAGGALCNYRFVTGRAPDGQTEVLLAALRFPVLSTLTCAEDDTTLCAGVDLTTGRLHAAESKKTDLRPLERHPVTGQLTAGWAVPRWAELNALALAAHDAWPEFPFIGWDISDTTAGLIILEGGFLWGGYLAQMSGNPPLGLTPFTRIYRAHLAHRVMTNVP